MQRDFQIDRGATARGIDNVRFRGRATVIDRLEHRAGSLIVTLGDLEHPFGHGQIRDGVKSVGQSIHFSHDGHAAVGFLGR